MCRGQTQEKPPSRGRGSYIQTLEGGIVVLCWWNLPEIYLPDMDGNPPSRRCGKPTLSRVGQGTVQGKGLRRGAPLPGSLCAVPGEAAGALRCCPQGGTGRDQEGGACSVSPPASADEAEPCASCRRAASQGAQRHLHRAASESGFGAQRKKPDNWHQREIQNACHFFSPSLSL